MKFRGLLVATLVLAALAGGLYWSNHHQQAASAVKASMDLPPKILSLKQADIDKLVLKKRGQDELSLTKDGAGKWQITAPQPFHADQDSVSSMLSTLSSLDSDRLIEQKAANLQQFGLSQPALEVDVSEKDGKQQNLMVGDQSPAGSSYYVALAGDPRVFTLASYNKNSIDKGLPDLRDKRLLTFDSDKVSQVELVSKKQTIAFGRNKDQWEILKPRPYRADDLEVQDVVRALSDAKMDLTGTDADAKKAAAAFAAGSPDATAKITDASGTEELQVRKNKDDYYAKSSIVAGVYKVSSELGKEMGKDLDAFRNKKLFDFAFLDPEKIELHDGSKAHYLSRSGEDWWSDGKKMDPPAVSLLVSDIRELSATKFVDSGFASPMMEITVTSKKGKMVEKVQVSKSGSRYIARRENEPALYELDSNSVADLQKAIGELKPEPAPAQKK